MRRRLQIIIFLLTLGFVACDSSSNDKKPLGSSEIVDANKATIPNSNPRLTGKNSSNELVLSGEIDFNNPPWEIGCDTLQSQMEMNICSGEALDIADSLLTIAFNRLINHLDSVYNLEKQNISSDDDKILLDYLDNLKKKKEAVIASRNDFIKYRNSMTEIISYQYSGGSMRPLAENMLALQLTVNQLKSLTIMTKEIIR
jgi:uncharacterized protein YecT (DUF1311 family)